MKRKIEEYGTPLKDWEVQINYGIKTGYNDAFIIDSTTKESILKNSPNSAEIIRPILKGRHIKKYKAIFDNQWIIFTRRGIDIEKYPAVKEHLLKYYDHLKPKINDDHLGRKSGNYKWYEIQDNVAYYRDFDKDKITWLELTDIPKFAYDDEKYFIEATAFIMTGEKLKYLVAFFNSKICEWYFDKITTSSGVGTNRWKKIYLQNLSVPIPSTEDEKAFGDLIDKILRTKSQNLPSEKLEREIDELFYTLFNLSESEIRTIDSNFRS